MANSIGTTLPGGYRNALGGPADAFYAQTDGTSYASLADACAAVPQAFRRNRTVNVAGQEYWWLESDLSDNGLVAKSGGPSTPGTGKLYDSLGTQTDGAPTNRLLNASLAALDQRKPWVGLADGQPPTGYDDIEAALASSTTTLANTARAQVDQPALSIGASFFGNGAVITLNEAVAVDGGNGQTVPGLFAVGQGSQVHDTKFLPDDPSTAKATVQLYHTPSLPASAFPSPADCALFYNCEIGYPLAQGGSNPRPLGAVLHNTQATAGTKGTGRQVIYLSGSSSITGPLSAGTVVVQPPGVPMPFVGTDTAKQWVVTDRLYFLGGKQYKWLGPPTQLGTLDEANANWVLVAGGSSATPGTGTARDPFAVGDNSAITNAVLDLSNTWVDGDLTAYGSAALQAAGAPPAQAGQNSTILVGSADVVTMDEFDKRDANGFAWRCRYSRRNDGTSGWTRIGKTA